MNAAGTSSSCLCLWFSATDPDDRIRNCASTSTGLDYTRSTVHNITLCCFYLLVWLSIYLATLLCLLGPSEPTLWELCSGIYSRGRWYAAVHLFARRTNSLRLRALPAVAFCVELMCVAAARFVKNVWKEKEKKKINPICSLVSKTYWVHPNSACPSCYLYVGSASTAAAAVAPAHSLYPRGDNISHTFFIFHIR